MFHPCSDYRSSFVHVHNDDVDAEYDDADDYEKVQQSSLDQQHSSCLCSSSYDL